MHELNGICLGNPNLVNYTFCIQLRRIAKLNIPVIQAFEQLNSFLMFACLIYARFSTHTKKYVVSKKKSRGRQNGVRRRDDFSRSW